MSRASLPIRAPLTWIGALAGIIAAGVVVPGCEFTPAQAEQLHVVLPLAMPISMLAALAWLGRRLVPREGAPRRRWIWITLAFVFAGELLFSLITAASMGEPRELPGLWLTAFAYFGPLLFGLFPVLLSMVARAREALAVRPGSLAAPVARRQVWVVALASPGPLAAVMWALPGRPLSTFAHVAFWLSAAAVPLIAAGLYLDVRAARVIANLGSTRGAEQGRGRLDLGLGDEIEIEAVEAPYRSSAAAPPILGDLGETRRFVTRAVVRSAALLVLAIGGCALARWALDHAPAPHPPEKPLDFDVPVCGRAAGRAAMMG